MRIWILAVVLLAGAGYGAFAAGRLACTTLGGVGDVARDFGCEADIDRERAEVVALISDLKRCRDEAAAAGQDGLAGRFEADLRVQCVRLADINRRGLKPAARTP